MSAEDPAAALIAQLAGEAEFIDGGGFSIDPEAARKKLASRQLADPHAWILLVIEAAELVGVEAIEIHERPTGLSIRLLGSAAPGLAPAEELPELFTWVFVELSGLDPERARLARARQLLALGVNAALALSVRSVSLASITPSAASRMVLRPNAGGVVGAITPETEQLELRFDSPGLLAGIEPPRELVLVAERCGWGRATIEVLGRAIPNRRERPEPRAACAVQHQGETVGHVEIRSDPSTTPVLTLVANGVALEILPLPGWAEGFDAVLFAGYERDLSLSHAIRDASFEQLFNSLRVLHDDLVAELHARGETLTYSSATPAPVSAKPKSLRGMLDDTAGDSIGHITAWGALGLGCMSMVTVATSPVAATFLALLGVLSGAAAFYYLRMRKVFGSER